jgi:hypothetical protein
MAACFCIVDLDHLFFGWWLAIGDIALLTGVGALALSSYGSHA